MKNPKDSTLRNVQAANKKIAQLSQQVKKLKMIQAVHGVEMARQNKVLKSLVKSFEEIIVT